MTCCKDKNQGCKKAQGVTTDYLVCVCMGVMYSEICDAIKGGIVTFDGLSEALGVGTGCNSCIPEVKAILEQELRPGCCKS